MFGFECERYFTWVALNVALEESPLIRGTGMNC